MFKISLENQVYVYSVDTSYFYNPDEMIIHNKLSKAYILRKKIKEKVNSKKVKLDRKKSLRKKYTYINKIIKYYKDQMYGKLSNNNEIRELNKSCITQSNIISVFDSVLSRTLGMKHNELNEDVIVVQTYFFQVLEDLIHNGFTYKGEKYVVFTASAGQIRLKKTMFIRESVWMQYRLSLMCGLTIESINVKGGINTNKLLAYLALCNSATDEWKRFNIDRSIVVEDLETNVEGVVDHIDHETFKIDRKKMRVPIPHTDGCGMILPRKSKKSFMVRLPWIKGLLTPFKFDEFALECGNTKVKDIYGKEWDIVEDKIEVIFTRSQFKMAKYYADWQDYKDKFREYSCQASKCNEEESHLPDAKINYQMLQSLYNMTDDELKEIAKDTNEDIKSIGNDLETMLRVLGATKENKFKNYTQQALFMYNELLNDSFSKEIIKDKKKSMVKDARAGKLNIKGKYTFILPDMYAFCEFLFNGDENPDGLLKDGEIYCSLYKESDKLDCLRSPHLYLEHAVRKNAVDEDKSKWLITDGLYTSVHDLISRILQFDCDGDKSLVCADETLISVAERHMEDIVPLYYEMATANKDNVNSNTIYNGLQAAYKGNIGIISNDISKIWNSENVDTDSVRYLTMYNNFVIDFAKTLYLPTFPKEIKKQIHKHTKKKVPHFFVYAKDKEEHQVEDVNNSVVNKLEKVVTDKRINFRKVAGKFDYRLLMKNKNVKVQQEIIDKFEELDSRKKWIMQNQNSNKNHETLFTYIYIRDELLKINSDKQYVTDILLKHLYNKNSKRKKTLWESFGDVIVKNLERNLRGTKNCESCGRRIKVSMNNKNQYCKICRDKNDKEKNREYAKKSMRKRRKTVNVKGL